MRYAVGIAKRVASNSLLAPPSSLLQSRLLFSFTHALDLYSMEPTCFVSMTIACSLGAPPRVGDCCFVLKKYGTIVETYFSVFNRDNTSVQKITLQFETADMAAEAAESDHGCDDWQIRQLFSGSPEEIAFRKRHPESQAQIQFSYNARRVYAPTLLWMSRKTYTSLQTVTLPIIIPGAHYCAKTSTQSAPSDLPSISGQILLNS
ncbi:hypothetical protein BOTBODRAFT_180955 [Botryobasidium botryosum FD-172 SS1]|uniref:Uncharacterized protein n=1 Tax=Botryobasidium botryosum (strain FD-172 SS1) TaxID=930990 RepID=A0A067LUW4_BOTB1|nr:hypothetical protein BOTBODRAFT_180955 [Botryobasidium botryosum FD-172 SS1]